MQRAACVWKVLHFICNLPLETKRVQVIFFYTFLQFVPVTVPSAIPYEIYLFTRFHTFESERPVFLEKGCPKDNHGRW
jgi:hypothetical protein